jgi:hypothetical protein
MGTFFNESEIGALFGVQGLVLSKVLPTADIVREAIFRQRNCPFMAPRWFKPAYTAKTLCIPVQQVISSAAQRFTPC